MRRAAGLALLAALLFGSGIPASKKLLERMGPLPLAGFLYMGSALALAAFGVARLLLRRGARPEADLGRQDLPRLLAVTAAGGVAAPLLLLWGQDRVGGAAASLLMNLEGVLTALLAWAFFREAVGRRVALASLLALGGAALIASDSPGGVATSLMGALAVAGACALWALDNNLTGQLSGKDPVAIGLFKSVCAALFSLGLSAALGLKLPGGGAVLSAMAAGALCYGMSLLCIILALRDLGSSRTFVLFGLAPFAGVAVSLAVLPGERLGPALLGAGVLMAAAMWLLLGERHDHAHTHEGLEHEHRHTHDDHHQHMHSGNEGPEPHAHRHRHEPLSHAHRHVPDLHHRHGH